MDSEPIAPDPRATTRDVLAALSHGYPGRLAARLWTGEAWSWGDGPPAFTLALAHPGALRAMFWPADPLGLGESYVFGDFDIEGDLLAFADWLRDVNEAAGRRPWREKMNLAWTIGRLPDAKRPRDPGRGGRVTAGPHQPERERQAIGYTYDLPGAFYALFLDRSLQYTCGYFADPDECQEAAQTRKMDYVCRKLRLRPGERFLDMGCGWGGLLVHAAARYGVEAVGVTLSDEQAAWAERAVDAAGLRGRVRVVRSDYQDFRAPDAFDKAASVGMGEHVRPENLPRFFGTLHDCVRPGGALLYHAIMLRPNTPFPVWTAFADRYVFPNGKLHTLLDALGRAAEAGFEVRDVENLREHYVPTLNRWLRRLESNRTAAVGLTDEITYRVFRLYLALAPLGFQTGVCQLNQVLLAKPDAGRAGLPLTRADWYT